MADTSIPVKTYILKVNLQCCEACPKKLEKLLMNTGGVYAFKINTEKGLVKVSSKVDIDILKKNIKKKVGKIAEIYHPKLDNSDTDFDSFDDDHAHHGVHNMRPMPQGASGFDPRMLGNVPMPQPVIARPPYYGEVQYRSGHYGQGMYNRPPPTTPPLPPHGYYGANNQPGPYVHSLYELREPPKGNSMFHAISDATAPPLPPHGYYGARLP